MCACQGHVRACACVCDAYVHVRCELKCACVYMYFIHVYYVFMMYLCNAMHSVVYASVLILIHENS